MPGDGREVACSLDGGDHPEQGLEIALGAALVVGLSPLLELDELVHQLGLIAAGERVPALLTPDPPEAEGLAVGRRDQRQRVDQLGVALEVDDAEAGT